MSNEYIPAITDLAPGTPAKSVDINSRTSAISSGFDKLPKPAIGKKGFGEPVAAADPVDDDHLTTKGWSNNAAASALAGATAAKNQTETDAAQVAINTAQVAQNKASVSSDRLITESARDSASDHRINAQNAANSAVSSKDAAKISEDNAAADAQLLLDAQGQIASNAQNLEDTLAAQSRLN